MSNRYRPSPLVVLVVLFLMAIALTGCGGSKSVYDEGYDRCGQALDEMGVSTEQGRRFVDAVLGDSPDYEAWSRFEELMGWDSAALRDGCEEAVSSRLP